MKKQLSVKEGHSTNKLTSTPNYMSRQWRPLSISKYLKVGRLLLGADLV